MPFFQRWQGISFSTTPPLRDSLMPVLLPSPCMLLLASPPQQAAMVLCCFHLPLPESLRSSTSVSAVAPLFCRAALCICHLRLCHPSASVSLLWKAMELAGGRSAHMSLILLANPARLSGVQPCSCMTKSDHGGVHVQCGRPHQQLCFHRRPAWPGHGFAFLR